eukprot:5740899-Prymnesium_polylepis.1
MPRASVPRASVPSTEPHNGGNLKVRPRKGTSTTKAASVPKARRVRPVRKRNAYLWHRNPNGVP